MSASNPHAEQIPHLLTRELSNGDLEQCAGYLAIMIDSHLGRHPDSEDMLIIFLTDHVVMALDATGYLDVAEGVAFEPLIQSEVHRFMAEYRTYPGANKVLARRVLERVSAFSRKDPFHTPREAEEPSESRRHVELVRSVTGYLDSHFRDPEITVTRTAEHFNMSVSYLSRVFHQTTGIKLGDYILILRFDEAKRLLRTTDQSVAEIGDICGFSSCSAFIRSFRSKVGITPGGYRRGAGFASEPAG